MFIKIEIYKNIILSCLVKLIVLLFILCFFNQSYAEPLSLRVDKYYSNNNFKEGVKQTLSSSAPYIKEIELILKKESMPMAYAYLPVIESEFKVDAKSRTGALGLWQLKTKTAIYLKLCKSAPCNERKDIAKSSEAAIKYLSRLYSRFKDPYLALAAYNGGPTYVSREILRQGTNDINKLVLREETENYVAKFIAVLKIIEKN